MPRLRVNVLGPFEVLDPHGAAKAIPRGKSRALLAYLAVEEDGASHETLAALFWPDASREAARHSLRQALSSLRKNLGVDVFLTDGRVSINSDYAVSDAHDFRAALAAGDDGEGVQLVHGVPFADVDTSISHAFEDWSERNRGQVLHRYAELLERSGRRAIDAGDEAQVHALVQRGITAGLDGAALRAAIYGANGTLPVWSTASVGLVGLEAFVFRLRSGAPPELGLVLEAQKGWTRQSLEAVLEGLPEEGRPVLLELELGSGDDHGVVAMLLRGLVDAPGGAAVDPTTLDVLGELESGLRRLEGNGHDAEVEAALEDAFDAVLGETPVLLLLAAPDLGLRPATLIARGLSLQGGEGIGIIAWAGSQAKLDALPVQALDKAVQGTRRIRESVSEVVLTPAAPPIAALPGRRALGWPFVAAAAAVVVAVLGVGLRGLTSPGVAEVPSVRGHDIVFCSMRAGPAHFFRWSSESGAAERISTDTAATSQNQAGQVGCVQGWRGSVRTDSLPLAVQRGDSIGYRAYDNTFSRRDLEGRAMPALDGIGSTYAWGSTLVRAPADSQSGATVVDWATQSALELTPPGVPTQIAGFSTDGAWIALRTVVDGVESLARVRADGSDLMAIVPSPIIGPAAVIHGDSVVFARGPVSEQEDGSLELFIRDLNTGAESQLTNNDWNDYQVDWSSDGRHICWQSEERGHFDSEIMVMELETREVWNLTASPGRDHVCRFTPDGSAIVFHSLRSGSQDVFVQALRDGEARNISNFVGWDEFTGFVERKIR